MTQLTWILQLPSYFNWLVCVCVCVCCVCVCVCIYICVYVCVCCASVAQFCIHQYKHPTLSLSLSPHTYTHAYTHIHTHTHTRRITLHLWVHPRKLPNFPHQHVHLVHITGKHLFPYSNPHHLNLGVCASVCMCVYMYACVHHKNLAFVS